MRIKNSLINKYNYQSKLQSVKLKFSYPFFRMELYLKIILQN